MPTRRRFFTITLGATAAAWAGRAWAREACPSPDPFAGGRLLGTLRLSGRGTVDVPLGTLLGEGLDARLFTDLSRLTPETLITPTDQFFVRTSYPDGIAPEQLATIRVTGLVGRDTTIAAADLAGRRQPMGAHLLECAGNADPSNFGLMSVGTWSGVPLLEVVRAAAPAARATRVLVSGVDTHAAASRRSQPGASWVFTLDDLADTGAFLATHLNEAPLTPLHGAPVRLVVPGWYACSCIKWVNEIVLQDEEAPATTQMREFAARTHQQGLPALARDFAPPAIDPAAMPVRIEKWRVADGLLYRIVGIVWGGKAPLTSLRLRLDGEEPGTAFQVCPPPTTARTWSLWSLAWRPSAPGLYRMMLLPGDPRIRARRLDLYFYARQVWIDEV